MKTIIKRSVTVASAATTTVVTVPGDVVLVGQVTDYTFPQQAQRMSVGNFPSTNKTFSRILRLTNEAMFCLRASATNVAIAVSALVDMIVAAEPTLTWAPKITVQPADAACDGDPAFADLHLTAVSETTPVMYAWKESTAAGGTTYGSVLTKTGIYDPGVQAAGTLTSNNTQVTAGKYVVVAGKVYQFVSATPAVEGDVLLETNADTTLGNLKDAINRDTPASKDGVKYKVAAAHPFVTCGAVASHHITVTAIGGGTGPNALPTTTDESTLSWGAATLASGSASAGGEGYLRITPTTNDKDGYNYQCTVYNLTGSTVSDAALLTLTLPA